MVLSFLVSRISRVSTFFFVNSNSILVPSTYIDIVNTIKAASLQNRLMLIKKTKNKKECHYVAALQSFTCVRCQH